MSVKFEAKIWKMGGRYIIKVPRAIHPLIQPYLNKNVIVEVTAGGEK
jgi:hypothetical protein